MPWSVIRARSRRCRTEFSYSFRAQSGSSAVATSRMRVISARWVIRGASGSTTSTTRRACSSDRAWVQVQKVRTRSSSMVPVGPGVAEWGEAVAGVVGAVEQGPGGGAGDRQDGADLVGGVLVEGLGALAGLGHIGEAEFVGEGGEAGGVSRQLAPRGGQREREVAGAHGGRVEVVQGGAQLGAGGQGSELGELLHPLLELVFDHEETLAHTPDNHGPFRQIGPVNSGPRH